MTVHVRPLLPLLVLGFLCQTASAQFLRGYLVIGPAPNNGSASAPASFGILPAPQPTTPAPMNAGNAYVAAVGIEQRMDKYLGAGLDFAGVLPGAGKIVDNTIGTVSPNGYIYLPHKAWENTNLDVYGTGGYTLLFRDFTANGVNVGGGANYWFKDHLGLVVEYRFLKVFGTPPPPTFASRYHQVRFGITFR